jgi:hypothetical protein
LPFETYEALGVLLGKVGSAVKWWIGDFLVIGEALYGERAAQASEALSLSAEGRQECLRVALAIPRSRRRSALSWWHHRQLAAKWITPSQREELLERAERERLTTRELEAIIRELRVLGSASRGATAECDEIVEETAAEIQNPIQEAIGGDLRPSGQPRSSERHDRRLSGPESAGQLAPSNLAADLARAPAGL